MRHVTFQAMLASLFVLALPIATAAQQREKPKPAVSPDAVRGVRAVDQEAVRAMRSSGETGFTGERDLGPAHLVRREFTISLSDCLANLASGASGHIWTCSFEFDGPGNAYVFNPDATPRVTYSDLGSDCRVTVKARPGGIAAQLTHAAEQRGGGPTFSRAEARACMRAAFAAENVEDRTFSILLLTPR